MKTSDKNNILAMFEELKSAVEEFESIDNPRLADYKDFYYDIKETIDVCQEEIEKDKNKTYSRTIERSYESRYLPMEHYQKARTMLRRLKGDKAKLDKFRKENDGRDKKDYIFVGITKDELINISKDLKFLNVLFETELKDYKCAYEEIFLNGMSLSDYSVKYLDGKKKTAENLCNKIYRMIAEKLKISSLTYNFKMGLPLYKNKNNILLAKMEEELVSNVILDNLDSDRPDGYFEGMRDAYIELCEAKKKLDNGLLGRF